MADELDIDAMQRWIRSLRDVRPRILLEQLDGYDPNAIVSVARWIPIENIMFGSMSELDDDVHHSHYDDEPATIRRAFERMHNDAADAARYMISTLQTFARIDEQMRTFGEQMPQIIADSMAARAAEAERRERERLRALRERWPHWPALEHDPVAEVRRVLCELPNGDGTPRKHPIRPPVLLFVPAPEIELGGTLYRTPFDRPVEIAEAIDRAARRDDGTRIALVIHTPFGCVTLSGPPWPFELEVGEPDER